VNEKLCVSRLHLKIVQRGFSAIVATVLIVSLTVIIGAVLAAYVIPFVKDTLSGSTSCVGIANYYSFTQSTGYNCYTSSHYKLSLAQRADGKGAEQIVGFNLVLESADGAGTLLEARATTGPTLIFLNGSTTYPGLPGPGNIKTYRYNSTTRYTRAKVYAVLASGKSCDQQEGVITLRQC